MFEIKSLLASGEEAVAARKEWQATIVQAVELVLPLVSDPNCFDNKLRQIAPNHGADGEPHMNDQENTLAGQAVVLASEARNIVVSMSMLAQAEDREEDLFVGPKLPITLAHVRAWLSEAQFVRQRWDALGAPAN